MAAKTSKPSEWPKQLGWLLLIWSASVGGLGLVAYGMRLLMKLAGLGA
jgi:hypothetical protein